MWLSPHPMDHATKRAPQGSNSYTGLSLRTPPPSVCYTPILFLA